MDAEIARSLVKYIYLQEIEIERGNVTRLFAAADYLAMEGVRRRCSDYLCRLLAPGTAISITLYARSALPLVTSLPPSPYSGR